MDATITSFELIAAVAPLVAAPNAVTDSDVDLTGRRVRHWTNVGALRPVGGVHIGRGRSRIYDRSEAYIASALTLLAENDQGIEVLTQVAIHLRAFCGDKPLIAGVQYDRWLQAIRGPGDVFFFLGATGRVSSDHPRGSRMGLIPSAVLSLEVPNFAGGVFVNLSSAFRLIRL